MYDDDQISQSKTCFSGRTPFQTGLILVLLVAVPFFIILLSIYVVSILVWNQSESCSKMCSVFVQWKLYRGDEFSDYPDYRKTDEEEIIIYEWNKTRTFSKKMFPKNKPRRSLQEKKCFNEPPQFPSVAALLRNWYDDDEDEKIIKCTVVILSPNWILTIEECLDNDIESFFLRINSNYWSKEGILRRIQEVVRFEKLIAVRMEPDLKKGCYKAVNISKKTVPETGRIFFWNVDMNEPLKKRTKFGLIQSTSFDSSCQFGAPIIDQNENLIGFISSCDRNGLNGSIYRNINEYFDWLQTVIKIL